MLYQLKMALISSGGGIYCSCLRPDSPHSPRIVDEVESGDGVEGNSGHLSVHQRIDDHDTQIFHHDGNLLLVVDHVHKSA